MQKQTSESDINSYPALVVKVKVNTEARIVRKKVNLAYNTIKFWLLK